MRFVFLDEGGISSHEPVAVVAGVIVHADEQLVPLERELERVKRKHIRGSRPSARLTLRRTLARLPRARSA